jgi:hypothetical protein
MGKSNKIYCPCCNKIVSDSLFYRHRKNKSYAFLKTPAEKYPARFVSKSEKKAYKSYYFSQMKYLTLNKDGLKEIKEETGSFHVEIKHNDGENLNDSDIVNENDDYDGS